MTGQKGKRLSIYVLLSRSTLVFTVRFENSQYRCKFHPCFSLSMVEVDKKDCRFLFQKVFESVVRRKYSPNPVYQIRSTLPVEPDPCTSGICFSPDMTVHSSSLPIIRLLIVTVNVYEGIDRFIQFGSSYPRRTSSCFWLSLLSDSWSKVMVKGLRSVNLCKVLDSYHRLNRSNYNPNNDCVRVPIWIKINILSDYTKKERGVHTPCQMVDVNRRLKR